MSVKKSVSLNNSEVAKVDERAPAKRRRPDQVFSFREVHIEPGKSLKQLDSNKFKAEIKRWAKAVVAYPRQVSSRFGSSRRSGRIGSSRRSGEIGSSRDSSSNSS